MCSNGLEIELSIVLQQTFGLGYNTIEMINPCRKKWTLESEHQKCDFKQDLPLRITSQYMGEKKKERKLCNSLTTESEIQTTLDNVQSYHTQYALATPL